MREKLKMQPKECPICFSDEIIKPSRGRHGNCFSCVACITEWTITKIREVKASFEDDIPCYIMSCPKKIQIKSIHQKLPINCQEKINEALFQVYLINEKDIRKCPNQTCYYAGTLGKVNCKSPFECLVCHAQWKEYQQLETYKSAFNKAISYKNEYFSAIRKLLFTKKCPNCESRIEKDGGCQHMSCSRCSFKFCWICEAPNPVHHNYRHSYHTIINSILLMTILLPILFIIGLLLAFIGIRYSYLDFITKYTLTKT